MAGSVSLKLVVDKEKNRVISSESEEEFIDTLLSFLTLPMVSLKLVVDKEKNRVIFAESEEEFIDILFSFLTLPMGTIIRLLGKRTSLGCMDKLYESVENFHTKYLETDACKTMLLQPRSAAERLCEDLLINVDDLNPRRLYGCPTFECLRNTNRLYSSISGTRCACGQDMNTSLEWTRRADDAKENVFLKGPAAYIITDDLHITPFTAMSSLSLIQKLGIKESETVEKRIVNVQRKEVLSLLKRLLLSTTPLTDVFLQSLESANSNKEEHEHTDTALIELEGAIDATDNQTKTINVKLVQSKVTNKVVYAEATNDLVDVIFSFLSFPLGSIVKLLNKRSSIVCADNLYHSVVVLAESSDFIKSEECKNMLLSPKLYSHFDCSNQIIKIEANQSQNATVQRCKICWDEGISTTGHMKCKHNVAFVTTTEINPKMPNSSTKNGGGYTKGSVKFMVTDDMTVTPMSPSSALDAINKLKAPITNLMEKDVSLGEAEVKFPYPSKLALIGFGVQITV